MAKEIIGTKNGQNYYVGSDMPSSNSTAITLDQLQPETPVKLSQINSITNTSDNLVSSISSVPQSIDSFIKTIQPVQTDAQKTQDSILNRISSLTELGANKSKDVAQSKIDVGLPDLQTQLTDLNNQIITGNAEYQKMIQDYNQKSVQLDVNAGGRGITTSELGGQQNALARLFEAQKASKAAELGLVAARAQAVAGNINNALQIAQNAVEAKYSPIEDELKIRESQLKAIEPILNREEKQQALKQQLLIDQRNREISDQKEKEKTINELAIKAGGFGAPASVVSAITNAKSTIEAINAAGKYVSDPLDRLLKQTQIDENRAQIAKIANEIKVSKQKLSVPAVSGSTTDFSQRLLNTATSKDNLTATERQSLSKALTVVDQLDALQSTISKENFKGGVGPFRGRVNQLLITLGQNPNAGVIQAQLKAVVPQLARGTFGEVGVLTDSDINNYMKTLPNLTSPQQQNDLVLAMTLKTVQSSIKNQLTSAANSGVNVSGWVADYNKVTNQISNIEDKIGVNKFKVNDVIKSNPNLAPMIKELYKSGASDGDILQALGVN